MATTVRLRRSVLYVPGSNARALEKGRGLDVDGIIFDLEDAVAPDAKETARAQVMAAIAAGGYGHRELIVRVNGQSTPWGRTDLEAAARSGADAVLLPKVDGAEAVLQAEAVLASAGAPDGLALWSMMETPRGILRAEEIAGASPRLAVLVMGTSDLAKDLHAAHAPTRQPLLTSLGLCLLAGRAAGLAVLDGVHLDLDDDDGFAAACRQGVELGFDGKTLIHPKTVAVANDLFAPSAAAVDRARRIIAAHRQASAEGRGIVVVDGKLIEGLHVEQALRTVALAEAIASRGRV